MMRFTGFRGVMDKEVQFFRSRFNFNTKLFRFILLLAFSFAGRVGFGQSQVFPAGSFIINMGIVPQTIGNGLKPYGLIYDIIKNYDIPVAWIINPSKAKDGTDFTYNSVAYKGGTFIISGNYITSAITTDIAIWTAAGVAGVYTNSALTLTPAYTFTSVPTWTLDSQNGIIAQGFLTNAGIPSAAYNYLAPSLLGVCNDLFVLPHADPTWAIHGNLLDWNLAYKGSIWCGCHAGSALANTYNPANTSQQMNFLMEKVTTAGTGIILPVPGSTNYAQNSLVLWGNHSNGTMPYVTTNPTPYTFPQYNSPTLVTPGDPVAQYMGVTDLAQQNGSEQVYLPVIGGGLGGWLPTTKVITYDPTQINTMPYGTLSNGPAVIIAYGRGFGDSNRGWVMLEASHNINNSTAGSVPAQRAFFNWSFLATIDKVPVITSITGIPSGSIFNAQPYPQNYPLTVNFSSPVSSGFNSVTWTCRRADNGNSVGTFTPNGTLAAASTSFTPPNTALDIPSNITVKVIDQCGRSTVNTFSILIKACSVTVTNSIASPTCYGSSNGSIAMTISGGASPYNWTWNRTNPVGGPTSGSGTTISNLAAGTYAVTVTDASGCTSAFSALLNQPNPLTATPSVNNVSCNGGTGNINLAVTGGTAPYTYQWSNSATTQNLAGVPAGTYNVTVTDTKNCTTTTSPVITQPAAALSVAGTITNVTCYGGSAGSITITASGGTTFYSYNWGGGITTRNRMNLAAGTYNVIVTDALGCNATQSFAVTQPAALALSTVATSPSCPPNAEQNGSNGAITLTVSGGSGGSIYSWSASNGGVIPSGQQSSQNLTGLVAGTYTVIVTDSNGCTKSISVILNYLHPDPVQPDAVNH